MPVAPLYFSPVLGPWPPYMLLDDNGATIFCSTVVVRDDSAASRCNRGEAAVTQLHHMHRYRRSPNVSVLQQQ